LHFSTEYEPILDLDSIFKDKLDNEILFISDKYKQLIPEIKEFLKILGVGDYFSFQKYEMVRRVINANLLPGYYSYVDNEKINSTIYSPWKQQHGLMNYYLPNFWKIFENYDVTYEFFKNYLPLRPELWETGYWVRDSRIANFKFISPLLFNFKKGANIPCVKNVLKNGSELFSKSLDSFIDDKEKVCAIDFSYLGELNYEKVLGIKQKLSLELCLKQIAKQKYNTQIKDVWERLKEIINTKEILFEEDKLALAEFKLIGKLPNQLDKWTPLGDLHYISDDFELGVGNNNFLLKNSLKGQFADFFGIMALTKDNFEPVYVDKEIDSGFKNEFKDKAIFIAIAEDAEHWKEIEVILLEIVNSFQFYKTRRIALSYSRDNVLIENAEKTFHQNENELFYVGKWKEARASKLFAVIIKELNLKNVSLDFFKQILLEDRTFLIEEFKNKNFEIPPELLEEKIPEVNKIVDYGSLQGNSRGVSEPRTTPIKEHSELASSTSKQELSEIEIRELERLLKNGLSDVDKKNANLIALIKGLNYLKKEGFDISVAEEKFEETYSKSFLEGVFSPENSGIKFNCLCRSAKNGMLFLSRRAWADISKPGNKLFVFVSDNDQRLFNSHVELAKMNNDSWILKLESDSKADALDDLLIGKKSEDSSLNILIRMNADSEYSSIFGKTYEKEKRRQESDLNILTGGDLNNY